jgi:diguanylate cyclase (GGDEF)-like protein
MVDIDHFKVVNDSLGHVAGDAVLREVSDCLSRQFCVRSDFVARYGGEEFVALLWDTPLAGARAAADKLVSSVRASRIVIDGSLVPVTVSVGVAQSRPGEMGQAWVERADRALYSAKAGGRNRAVLADDDLGPPADSTAARVR